MPFKQRIEDESPEDVHVYIKKSKIKDAKKGLYVSKKILKGDVICKYMGVYVPMHFVDLEYYDSEYMFQDSNDIFVIDASDPLSCYGRYANDSLSLKKINAKIVKANDENWAELIAIRNIKKNEEIYISYGEGYWLIDERFGQLSQEDQDFVTSGELNDYIDTIGVENDSEDEYEEDEYEEDEDYNDEEEEYDSD
jgi:hypothetical protein